MFWDPKCQKNSRRLWRSQRRNPGAFLKAGPIFQQPFSLLENAQTLAGIAFRATGESVKNFPAASKFAGKLFQKGLSDSHSLLECSEKRGDEGGGQKAPVERVYVQFQCSQKRVHAKGVCTLRKGVFLPSKQLLSAFYKTLRSKIPSENLVFWPLQVPSKNPSKKHSLLKSLLRTLLRSVLLHDLLGVHPMKNAKFVICSCNPADQLQCQRAVSRAKDPS